MTVTVDKVHTWHSEAVGGHMILIKHFYGYFVLFQIQTQPETQSLEGHIPGGARVNLVFFISSPHHRNTSVIAENLRVTQNLQNIE